MIKHFKRFSVFILVTFVLTLVLTPFLSMRAGAAELGPTSLFLGRLKVAQSTDMVLMFVPNSTFDSETDDRELKIYFPTGEDTDWCLTNDTTLTVVGTTNSAAEDIDAALPGTLVGKCFQGTGGASDYIEITGIDDLTEATSYGVQISSHAQLKTGPTAGQNLLSVQLVEGTKVETISFNISLIADDQVVVSATVDPANTITCGISNPTVGLGTLYKGGAYITGTHNITTSTDTGYYWAVYGTGDGSTAAGLYKSTATTYLLSAAGVGNRVNLLTGEGFGLVLTTAQGTVDPNYSAATPGEFGAIGRSFANATLILWNVAQTTGEATSTVILGARAGASAQEGSYQETLTYVCGAYVGE